MLFPYLLLVFALTSVAAAREKWEGLLPLLLGKDLRLTEEGYRFIRLMSVKLAASRPRDRLYDDNIQFGTAPTITHFKLKRKFQPPNQYCLDGSGTETYNTRVSHQTFSNTDFGGKNGLQLKGIWGRTKKLLVAIEWADSEEWIVRFLDVSEKNKFTAAPRVYTLNRVAKNQLAKSQRESRQWRKLLHNTDPRLTRDVKKKNYWYQLKPEEEGATFLWSDDEKYENVIQLIPAGTPGVPIEHGNSGVIAISHLRLKRGFKGSNHNQYCLDVSAPRMFHGPLRDGYNLEGFWGQSKEPTRSGDGPVITPSELRNIIRIQEGEEHGMWEVQFPGTQPNRFTTAPRVYTLTDELAKQMMDEERKKQAEISQSGSGRDQGVGLFVP